MAGYGLGCRATSSKKECIYNVAATNIGAVARYYIRSQINVLTFCFQAENILARDEKNTHIVYRHPHLLPTGTFYSNQIEGLDGHSR